MLEWVLQWLNRTSDVTDHVRSYTGLDIQRILSHRPLIDVDSALGRPMPLWKAFLQHSSLGGYWAQHRVEDREHYGMGFRNKSPSPDAKVKERPTAPVAALRCGSGKLTVTARLEGGLNTTSPCSNCLV
jgi:hypothetical protein